MTQISSLDYRYQTIEFKTFDIHLKTLKNIQQFSDDKNEAKNLGINDTLWPIFGVIWPAAYVLADLMEDFNTQNLSILEVGTGIGLSSLVLNQKQANITSTDYHPESQVFLAENVKLNNGKSINFFLSNWDEYNPQIGKYDLIIGSDLLYESTHPKLLSSFIQQHAQTSCQVILAVPNRGYQKEFNAIMEEYSFEIKDITPKQTRKLDKPFDGRVFSYTR